LGRDRTPIFFAPAIEDVKGLVVPTLSLYEVFNRVLQQRGEGEALQAVAMMMEGRVVELTAEIALAAARLSVEMGLPMADSVMLATAWAYQAELWTQDADLESRGALYSEMRESQGVRK